MNITYEFQGDVYYDVKMSLNYFSSLLLRLGYLEKAIQNNDFGKAKESLNDVKVIINLILRCLLPYDEEVKTYDFFKEMLANESFMRKANNVKVLLSDEELEELEMLSHG